MLGHPLTWLNTVITIVNSIRLLMLLMHVYEYVKDLAARVYYSYDDYCLSYWFSH